MIRRQLYLIPFILAMTISSSLMAQENETAQFKVTSLCMEDSVRLSIINIGSKTQDKELDYYVIEDEVILKQGTVNNLSSGDSLNIIHYQKGLDVSLELEDPNGKKGHMISSTVTNCGTTYPLTYRTRAGKYSQVVTGKHNNPWAIGIYAGTLGPGLTISKNLGAALSIRIGGTYLPLSFKTDALWGYSDTDIDVKLMTIDFKLDYYISKNPKNQFHVTLGGLYNGSSVNTISRAAIEEEIKIGNQTITNEEIGTASIGITPNKFNVFLGAGVGRLAHYRKRVGLKLEMGGLFTGSPNATLDATGTVSPTAEQEGQLQQNLRQYYVYPVLNIYLSVKL